MAARYGAGQVIRHAQAEAMILVLQVTKAKLNSLQSSKRFSSRA
jgi:hypothetical protein